MKKFFAILLLILATPSFANTDDVTVTSAKEAVNKLLEARYKPGECSKWKVMASGGAISQGSAIAKCDNDFNPAYGLDFSSIKEKKVDDAVSVCGIVSGRTELSRIGARFVYESKTGHVTIKPSKFPMASLASSGDLGKNLIKIENKQYHIVYNSNCK
ncbi:hypothetical protein LWV32_02300 [Enterobacter asburiae]|uniref:hypothetical protein n=1 Tax=Enterobacter asburiae TaxID=61645 RepID=UPI000BA0F7C3|nr:hypothetical protein [Enterobacter asburiae]MCE1340622.1 hypothetical protein [Enterobacter asburiae]OZP70107.1 hypothetical protein CIG53_02290 [Enterobacter asburiae]QBB06036.1 hypothetical protein EVV94_14085 [Enterobacter cloacae]